MKDHFYLIYFTQCAVTNENFAKACVSLLYNLVNGPFGFFYLLATLHVCQIAIDAVKADLNPLVQISNGSRALQEQCLIFCIFLLQWEPFKKLMDAIADQQKISCSDVMFSLNDVTVRPSDTPNSVGLKSADIIGRYRKWYWK